MNPSQTKVLIVEDEAIVAYDLQNRLRKSGYTVSAIAASGAQALEGIEKTSPDLILMDIRLQGPMDGIEVATEVRHRYKLPVIFLTAHADHATLERAKLTGPFGYLVKPIGNINLSSAIEVALHKHRAERQLQDREAWLSTVLGSMADAIVVTDALGTIQFMNPTAECLTGWTHSKAVGQRVSEVLCLIDFADRSITAELVSAAAVEGVAAELPGDVRLVARGGRSVLVEGQIAISQAENRAIAGTVITFRDVTARNREQVHIRQEQKMLVASRLACGIARDFNNLLNVILGRSEELLREMGENNASRERIQAIRQAGSTAAAFTTQLLGLCPDQVLQPQKIDLNSVVDRLLPILKSLTGPSIQVQARLDPDLGKIRADASQIEQVLLNLVLNARDAMRQGGEVSIQTENIDLPGRGELEAEVEPFVRMVVKDTGAGMDREIADHIFEPFFTTKQPGQGAGLGLAIVHAIVSAGDGLINVESKPGAGAQFEIFLPRLGEARAVSAPAWSRSDGLSTVLVVDDLPEVRSMLRDCFEPGRYNFLEAANDEEAWLIARTHKGAIDLLVTDISKATMNDSNLGLRLSEVQPRAKVLFISGHPEDFLREDQPEVSFIQKPFTKQALLERIREILA